MAALARLKPFILERDDYECVVSGTEWQWRIPCSGDLTLQHRVARGAGGSGQYDQPEFLVIMCWRHNMLEPANSEFRQACEDHGWSIPRKLVEPPMGMLHDDGYRIEVVRRIPVHYRDGWHELDEKRRKGITDEDAQTRLESVYGKQE